MVAFLSLRLFCLLRQDWFQQESAVRSTAGRPPHNDTSQEDGNFSIVDILETNIEDLQKQFVLPETQNHPPPQQLKTGNYVVLSSTIEEKHHVGRRPSDYDFLAPVAALNWYHKGFIPIIIVVSADQELMETVQELWKIILPSEAIVVPILIKYSQKDTIVSVGQTIRHYAALLLPRLNDNAYLRITDADMLILDRGPFLPYDKTDIDVFDGECCGANSNQKFKAFREVCQHYPMHSIGMKVRLWRHLFTSHDASKLSTTTTPTKEQIVEEVYGIFEQFRPKMKWGKYTPNWYIDQRLSGCVIGNALARNNVTIHLGPGPSGRIHIPGTYSPNSTDMHLAGFNLTTNGDWLKNILITSKAIGPAGDAVYSKYEQYVDAWRNKRSTLGN